ncbi:MAG: hypothetical protein K1X39_12690, partial [Thermoflexales bacterium]|nr:hypothetical protein [Thermoflexales bacterium]
LRERGIRAGSSGPATRRLVVTEYARGAGDPLCVEARAAIGLGSACVVLAENPRQKLTVPILLAPGTLLAPQRTRAAWRLSVPTRRVEVFEGRRFARGRRLVVAFGGPG